jgi:hypothetical protein
MCSSSANDFFGLPNPHTQVLLVAKPSKDFHDRVLSQCLRCLEVLAQNEAPTQHQAPGSSWQSRLMCLCQLIGKI